MRELVEALAPVVLLVAAPLAAARAQLPSNIRAAARYSGERAGDAVLLFRHDSLVFEEYQNGYDGKAAHPLASGTKAFSCVLAALGQADGLLTLGELAVRTIPELRGDSLAARVTIRELLNLTSGLQTGDRPGRRFTYGGVSFDVFGVLLARKLGGTDPVVYLRQRIFTPLGIAVAYWERDDAGRPRMASGAFMAARDWGWFGVLVLDGGRWRGRELVPAAALAECGRGSAANPGYGLGLWLNRPDPRGPAPSGVERAGRADRLILAPDLPHDLWLAAGAGGQRLYILPTPGIVVVRFGHNTGPEYQDDVFLRALLGGGETP